MIDLTPGTTVLFTGDSVTDCGRRDDPELLGDGYVRLVAERLPAIRVLNAGVSGNRAVDLESRWPEDVQGRGADVVSILVGINDTWRRYDSDDPTSAEAFEATYRRLLAALAPGTRIVLMEPFLLPVTDEQRSWREDLDPRIEIVHRLAEEFEATLVPTDAALTALAEERGPAAIAPDGVHPTPEGHAAIADVWIETVTG